VPLLIELVDSEENILAFFEGVKSQLEGMKYGCLVTLNKASALLYKSGSKKYI
jgi:PII-like signaling protein